MSVLTESCNKDSDSQRWKGREIVQVDDEDVARARASGMSEDAIFEVVVCAAVGRATRRHEAALARLESERWLGCAHGRCLAGSQDGWVDFC